MTTTINASPSNGLVQTADGSGILKVQSNGVTTNALAWVNFNGVTTTTIRSSYNVSSVTRNGAGDYTVNYSSTLSDANYSFFAFAGDGANTNRSAVLNSTTATTSATRFGTIAAGSPTDVAYINFAVFGN